MIKRGFDFFVHHMHPCLKSSAMHAKVEAHTLQLHTCTGSISSAALLSASAMAWSWA